jgi:biopolymer transport protein ExbD
MAGAANSDDDEIISAINVTPLVDIVLVLLIVLMVTSNYLVNKSTTSSCPRPQRVRRRRRRCPFRSMSKASSISMGKASTKPICSSAFMPRTLLIRTSKQ